MPNVHSLRITYPDGEVKQYDRKFQTAPHFARGWHKTLQRAYGTAQLECLCSGTGNKRLSVKHYDETDAFGLARYPETGEEHALDCRFYAPGAGKSGMRGYEKKVIEARADGKLKIRLAIGLKEARPASAGNPTPPSDGTGRTKAQPAMRLGGLLHFLWTQADLNVWPPVGADQRNQVSVNLDLDAAARNVVASRMTLDSVLLLPDSAPSGKRAAKNRERIAAAVKTKTRMLVIAPLAQYAGNDQLKQLSIVGFQGIPIMDLKAGKWESAVASYPLAVGAWKNKQKVMVLAELSLKKEGRYADVVDLALMTVTAHWIPVESSYEARIAEMLVAQSRAFSKPMRFDAEADVVFPDFILRDTGSNTPLEVFGRSDTDYEARKAAKIAYYQREFRTGQWWCWNAAADPDGERIPAFPPPAGA